MHWSDLVLHLLGCLTAYETPPAALANGPLVMAGVAAEPPDPAAPVPVALASTDVACVPLGQEVTAAIRLDQYGVFSVSEG